MQTGGFLPLHDNNNVRDLIEYCYKTIQGRVGERIFHINITEQFFENGGK